MPRITAPTVAEHRALQRAALLDAASKLLASGGVDAVTPKSVGGAAGLARSSVYQYFDSSAAILAAVVEELFPVAMAELDDVIATEGTQAERLDSYVEAALRIAGEPTHQALYALSGEVLPAECRARVSQLHARIQEPLVELAVAVDPEGAELRAELLAGLIASGASAIMHGRRADEVIAEVQKLVATALGL